MFFVFVSYQHQTFQIEDIQRSNKAVLNALQVKLQEKIYKSQVTLVIAYFA